MKKLIAKFVFFIFGWKTDYKKEYKVPKTVMLASPHTSNWDLVFALGVYWMEGIDAKFLIKNNYTKSFLGFFFKWLGAIGVDRTKHNNLVDYSAELFNGSEELVLMVPKDNTVTIQIKNLLCHVFNIIKKSNAEHNLMYRIQKYLVR